MERRSPAWGVLFFMAITIFAQPGFAADQALIDAAKADGQLTWYTTFIVDQVARPLAQAFTKKYGIKVNYVRSDATEIVLRAQNEAKAGKLQADVFDGTSGVLPLEQAGLLDSWRPDEAARLPANMIDPQNRWTAASLYILSIGYNTDLVKPDQAPRSLQDLLDPKWKGNLAISNSPSSPGIGGFTGLVLTSMGQDKGMEYLRKFAAQKPHVLPVSSRQVLDQVIAGEYPVGVEVLNHHVAYSAARGAPVAWSPMNPSLEALLVVGLLKGPHRNAGKLFIDFVLSDEGQKILRDADYIPTAPNVTPKDPKLRPDVGKFATIFSTPEIMDKNSPQWTKTAMSLLR